MKWNNCSPVMRIEWGEDSRNDLREILDFLDSSFGVKKAERVFAEIHDSVKLLLVFPLMGKEFVKDAKTGIVYHTVPSKFHQIIYFVEGETIKIVAVWNNRRNIRRLKRRLRQRKRIRK